MTKIEAKPRIIEGEWDWRDISINLPGGWIVLDNKPEGEHIWCFRADGLMKSRMDGQIVYDVEYHFDSKRMRLTLYGWQLCRDGAPKNRIYETYRVEFPSPSEMLLYDLEEVEPGEMELLRLRFGRV